MNPTDPLSELRGLSIPEPPLFDWWPLSTAWWIVLVVVVAAAYFLAKYVAKKMADNAYKQAKQELQSLQLLARDGEQDVLVRCSALCRRVAMLVESREAIAGLTGAGWLAKLDQLSGSREFTTGCGSVFNNLLWQKSKDNVEVNQQIFNVLERLIENNKSRLSSIRRAR